MEFRLYAHDAASVIFISAYEQTNFTHKWYFFNTVSKVRFPPLEFFHLDGASGQNTFLFIFELDGFCKLFSQISPNLTVSFTMFTDFEANELFLLIIFSVKDVFSEKKVGESISSYKIKKKRIEGWIPSFRRLIIEYIEKNPVEKYSMFMP